MWRQRPSNWWIDVISNDMEEPKYIQELSLYCTETCASGPIYNDLCCSISYGLRVSAYLLHIPG